jgi:hypothetical protein
MLNRTPFNKELIELCPASVEDDYCCHAYTLQVHKDPEILRHHQEIFVDINIGKEVKTGLFFLSLFKKGLLEQVNSESELRDDDLILYFIGDKHLAHSGRIKNGRVISKWGGRAKHPLTGETLLGDNVWMHHWEDIPNIYRGDRTSVRLFRIKQGITTQQISQVLLEFKDELQHMFHK